VEIATLKTAVICSETLTDLDGEFGEFENYKVVYWPPIERFTDDPVGDISLQVIVETREKRRKLWEEGTIPSSDMHTDSVTGDNGLLRLEFTCESKSRLTYLIPNDLLLVLQSGVIFNYRNSPTAPA
jgi:hypothetical protein